MPLCLSSGKCTHTRLPLSRPAGQNHLHRDVQRALEGKVFDAVCAFGSMRHAPREFIQKQARLLRDHLAPGGLWVQLAYPINRFRNTRPADNLPNMQAMFYGDGLSFNNGGWGVNRRRQRQDGVG